MGSVVLCQVLTLNQTQGWGLWFSNEPGMNQMSFPLERRCGSMNLQPLTAMGCEVGEWDVGHCGQKIGTDAGQPSARKHVRGVRGLAGELSPRSHTFLLLRLISEWQEGRGLKSPSHPYCL